MDKIWEKVLKATTVQGEKTGFFYLAKFPELEKAVNDTVGGWMGRWNEERVICRWLKRKDNVFKPKVISKTGRGLYGKIEINSWQLRDYDVEFNEPRWGELDAQSQNRLIAESSRGRSDFTLGPNELGITIIEDIKRPYHQVWIDIPNDTDFVYMPEMVPLTNAEAAVLYIRAWYDDYSKSSLKKQRAMFEQFGLGKLVNIKHEENPIIMGLVEKGLFRLNRQRVKEDNLRGFPEITPKGRSVAPEMDKPDFVTGFKQEVLRNPNDEFLFIPEGIDEDDWFTT